MRHAIPALFAVVSLAVPGLVRPTGAATSCEDLAALTIANTVIASTEAVPAGPLSLPGAGRGLPGREPPEVPAFCRVRLVSEPVPDSQIHIEVWLPSAEAWNGKFLGTGNGGYSGALGYAAMAAAVRRGYATAGSDTGHEGGDLAFGAGHPEKINDWGYRAIHVMTETSKLIVRNHYGRFAEHSYFSGCSTGGHQALMEAQRFPTDYDGIVAGAPGNNRVRLNVGFLWSWLATNADPANPFPAPKLRLLNSEAIAACDAIDGVEDELISDPRRCQFDPGALLCEGPENDTCLTGPQVEAARKVYGGAKNPRTGEQIYPGWARGSEASGGNRIGGWAGYFVGRPEPARVDFWRLWVFDDPNWDLHTFDFDRDVAYAATKLAAIDAVDPDLTAFNENGGKLLMYHGWADAVVPPEDSVQYYENVVRTLGGMERTGEFFRLFMVPGMEHCGGGSGPNDFDALNVLDQWVAKGIAPDRIVVSHATDGTVDRTRPLCPYPLVARWNGTGSTDDAAAFVCAPETGSGEGQR